MTTPGGPGAPGEVVAQALARLYDLDLVEDPGDLDLYLALANRTGGPVLELAAGTGRLAIPLAVAGHTVTAVDIDPAMLARARTAAERVDRNTVRRLHLVEADLIGLNLPEAGRFQLAILGLNSLFLLGSRDAQRDAIRTLARHLGQGGLAVVDVWLPDAEDLGRFDGRLALEYVRVDPETGHEVTKVTCARHDATSGVVDLTTIYEEGRPGGSTIRWIRRDGLRLIGPDELRAHVEDAGLVVDEVAGSYDMEPIRPGNERAILVAHQP
jgi:SAM-dependent methyltransferase